MYGCRQSQCKLLCRPTVVGTAEPDADTCWKRRGKRRIDVWKIYFCKFRACREILLIRVHQHVSQNKRQLQLQLHTQVLDQCGHTPLASAAGGYICICIPPKKNTHTQNVLLLND